MRTVGVAGTAKNTGKTTCLVAVLTESTRRRIPSAVTSIGYDGEEFDHLTGLPKPRVTLQPGTVVATAEGTLPAATAGLELLGGTGVFTALGEVILARAKAPGLVALAGPPTGPRLQVVLSRLSTLGVELCLVDGAFGRMAPMVALDGLLLATGAARRREIPVLVAETAALAWLFGLAEAPAPEHALRVSNLLTARSARELLSRKKPAEPLLVGGAITEEALGVLAEWDHWIGASTCTFADSVQLTLGGHPLRVRALLERLGARCRLGVVRRVPLLAFAVSPFYPELQPGGGYRAAYLEPGRLRREMAAALEIPVLDVRQDGVGPILESLRVGITV